MLHDVPHGKIGISVVVSSWTVNGLSADRSKRYVCSAFIQC